MQTIRTHFAHIFAGVAIAMVLFTSAPFAFAAHMSGQDYLNRVNEQRIAAGQSELSGSSATALVNMINAMGDTEFAALQQANQGRSVWMSSGSDIGRVIDRAGRNPDGTPNVDSLTQIAAERRLQNPQSSSCILFISFDFVECVGGPLAKWTSSLMLSLGGNILRLSGAIFDFGVNHVIINFKETLDDKLKLMPIINSGWTFFRDIANILIIGLFVFIAISLILGLKEYGQKKLVARVLIIAVLMNFSLLFTKIIIDSSNFIAYAIYAQTAGAGASGFSIADKVLAPLHVTGTWDTTKLAEEVYKQGGGAVGAVKAFAFGLFGFLILVFLAAVIFYGAFLILARAILFIFLMLTAPIAYATYLAPNFEASEFGWSNWWKSLINNAAFAPLLMVFLSISILIMQTASPSVNPSDTIGALITDPPRQVLTDGWKVLFIYVLGTGLLFASFRLSSSLAGSISGIKIGQMAAGLPLVGGAVAAGWLGQRTLGRYGMQQAQKKDVALQQARIAYNSDPTSANLDKILKLEKQKARAQATAGKTFNAMNSGLGKALAGSAGLKGALAGETKGNWKDMVHKKEEEAIKAAKAAALTDADKKKIREDAVADANKDVDAKIEAKNQERSAAEKSLKEAASSLEGVQGELAGIEKQMQSNRDASGEYRSAVGNHDQLSAQKDKIAADFKREMANLQRDAEGMVGDAREQHTLKMKAREVEHQRVLDEQDQRIKVAAQHVSTVDTKINATILPKHQEVQSRLTKVAEVHQTAQAKFDHVTSEITGLTATKAQNTKAAEADAKRQIAAHEERFKTEGLHVVTEKYGTYGGQTDTVISNEVHHGLEGAFKKKSGADRLKEVLKAAAKEEKAEEK